jgi:hypothetical protein
VNKVPASSTLFMCSRRVLTVIIIIIIIIIIKVKVALEQATKAERGSRSIVLLFL